MLGWGVAAVAAALTGGCATTVSGAPRAGSTTRPSPSTSTTTSGGPSRPQGGAVTIAVSEYAPYLFTENGQVTGQIAEVARHVLESLGIREVEFEVTDYEALIPKLLTGRVDLIGGLGISQDRCGQVAFSVPDHVSRTSLAVPKGNPKGLENFDDVKTAGARIAVIGQIDYEVLRELGVPDDLMVKLPDPAALPVALAAGEVDCGSFDEISLRYLVASSAQSAALETTPGFTRPRVPDLIGAFAFRDEDTELRADFDEALTELHESGEWLSLSEPFGFDGSNRPDVELTVDKACSGG